MTTKFLHDICCTWCMDKKERMMREMEEMLREIREKVTMEEWVKRRLQWEDWEGVGKDAVNLAKQELSRRHWRGGRQGVLPRGYDAETIAWEAMEIMVRGQSRLVPGWTRERLLSEVGRLISRKVRLLNSLKETKAVRNEWDIAPRGEDGEPVSILPEVPGDEPNGYDAAVEAEEGREFWRKKVERELEGEPELKGVFECLCQGETKTREIACRLGVAEKAVLLARKRLARRLKRMRAASG